MVIPKPLALPEAVTKKRRGRPQIQTAIMPRWLRINGAVQYSGFSRAKLYELIAQGKIKTALVRATPDSQRGIRLLDRFDLDAYINVHIDRVETQLRQEQQQLLEEQKQLDAQHKRLAQERARIQRELENLEPRLPV